MKIIQTNFQKINEICHPKDTNEKKTHLDTYLENTRKKAFDEYEEVREKYTNFLKGLMNQGKASAENNRIQVVTQGVSSKKEGNAQECNISDKRFADDLTKLRNTDLANIKNLITELDMFSNEMNSTLQSSGALINNVQTHATSIRDNIASGRGQIDEAINSNNEGLNLRILKWTGALLALLLILYLLIKL